MVGKKNLTEKKSKGKKTKPEVQKAVTTETVVNETVTLASDAVATEAVATEAVGDEVVVDEVVTTSEGANTETDNQELETKTNEDVFLSLITVMRETMAKVEKEVKDLKSGFRTLEQEYKRKCKLLEVSQNKKFTTKVKRTTDPKVPSGIKQPTLISGELAKFLELDPDTKIARTDATKKISLYVKNHNLENHVNRRQIIPDAPLKNLLNLDKENNEITYFNIQKLLKQHFPKPSVKETTSV